MERPQSLQGLGAHSCPILKLPIEAIAEIFCHFLPVYPDPPPAMGLYPLRSWVRFVGSGEQSLFRQLWRAIELTSPDTRDSDLVSFCGSGLKLCDPSAAHFASLSMRVVSLEYEDSDDESDADGETSEEDKHEEESAEEQEEQEQEEEEGDDGRVRVVAST
ncbi:hypothetical protein C8J57DRAFT_1725168 [Mycena rebaudengoi]|nr:hypothetical protein C8J57DRAFT_1725168 [Mycena rebaudengoi]